jgi:serine/threonine-protein kinase
MLHDEANVAAAVKHPNIVVTIDVGFEEGNHFVVMDFVSGDTLSRLVRDMKKRGLVMPPWAVAWVGSQVAGALHSAHEARTLSGERLEIVHRDVSLQNVMLSDAGHPMLFDFGVAKAKQRIVHTSHGELKGKLAYMAPETFRGAPVDRTVDVFGLGVVLYELLTNLSPFQRANDVDTITALQTAPIEPPSRLKPGDPRLDAIVLTAMARDRAYRYPTAQHVEHALREWARAAGMPHEAAPVASWLEETFPDRLAARRALLGRIADPHRAPRLVGDRPSGGYPLPTHPSAPVVQGGWGSTPAPQPPTDPSSPAMLRGEPATGSQVTVGGVSRRATTSSPPSVRLAAVAIGIAGIVAGGLLAYVVATRTGGGAAAAASSSASAAPVPAATVSATASAPPAPSAEPAATTTASASASTPASVAAAVPVAPRWHPRAAGPQPAPPPAAPSADPAKAKHGPILRDYQ